MQPAQDSVIGGKYRLIEKLAEGGMGSVWSAHHEKLDARVAVKFMSSELTSSDEMRSRFEQEAKAAAKLRSPHVVQVLDFGVEEGTPFIVMERLQGVDLRTRLKGLGRLSLRNASSVLTQACKALRLAAEAGIIHRDLKPGNIFLARSGDDETVKILDFGVAKAANPTVVGHGTTSGVLMGSPHYMSPEQARGHKVDHRSDLFSMAVILFQMLTGKKPFGGKDLGDVIVKICSDPVPIPTEVAPDLPPDLDAFFEKALARHPDDRYQSARELSAAFASLVAEYYGDTPPPMSGPAPMPDLMIGETSYDDSPTVRSPHRLDIPKLGTPGLGTPGLGTPGLDTPGLDTPGLAPPGPGTLTLATNSVSVSPRSKQGTSAALIGLVAMLIAAVAVFFFTNPASDEPALAAPSDPPSDATEPESEPNVSPTPQPSAAAPPDASVTASAVASAVEPPAEAKVAAPRRARPAAAPKAAPKEAPPATPPPAPPAPKPGDKHPVLGI